MSLITDATFLRSTGILVQTDEYTQTFEDGLIDVAFDEFGELIEFDGQASVSGNITENASIVGSSKMEVKLLTGADINADEKYGITLKENRRYFVYHACSLVTLNTSSSSGVVPETLNMPEVGGSIIIITDPLDPFLYWYASTPIGDRGEGNSVQSLIPFVPTQAFSGLSNFDGQVLERAKMGIGFKFVDFFEVEGTRVIDKPDVSIDWENPLQSEFSYQAGINGRASFSFGIPGNTFQSTDSKLPYPAVRLRLSTVS